MTLPFPDCRLFRFVITDELGPGVVARLDAPTNVLRIAKGLYDQLSAASQRALLRTTQEITVTETI